MANQFDLLETHVNATLSKYLQKQDLEEVRNWMQSNFLIIEIE